MQISHSVEELALALAHAGAASNGTGITIGNFDGVHLGHQALIQHTRDICQQKNLTCVLLTFWPHPRVVVTPHKPHAPLNTREERLRLLGTLGIPHVLELPFDRDLAALSPTDFVEHCLMPLRMRHLAIGYDFSLGRGRSGHVDVLREIGSSHGFSVTQLPPVIAEGAIVSSTRLRDYIARGDVWGAAHLLGRWHGFAGSVIHGDGRGTGLGFPTANLLPPDSLLPCEGVYASLLEADGQRHFAVSNVGRKPTFGGSPLGVESFLPDVDAIDLYGQQVRLEFVARLRGEQRFASVEALRTQIVQDVGEARKIISSAVADLT